jgi:hypothetical protein
VCSNFYDDFDAYQNGTAYRGRAETAKYAPVKYLYCHDNRLNDLSWCSQSDAGESFQEVVEHYRRSWRERYPRAYFRNFRASGPAKGSSYDTVVEAYRPGSEVDQAARVQTVFLDFDGARVNTGIWGGPGVRELSPFSTFLGKWGLTRAQEATVIDKITATVRENIRRDLIEKGLNDDVAVQVTNSKDNPDLFGKPNVSRVIVGGTIDQSGISTIGIAQYIDPGNFGHQDEAIVLLDVLSAPAGPASSLNTYLDASSDRIAFVTAAVANVTAHEVGHTIGNYHTDNADEIHNMMDSGGANFGQNLYGVGPDNVGGTADDENIEFQTDTYAPVEGFTGLEDTENVTSWAFAGR